MDNRPIGVFDSGVGGLTVVAALRKLMPRESILYLGDTARVPYGAKSRETILSYGRDIVRFLQARDVKAAVAACGTVSSNAYDTLAEEFDLPMVDVIRPGVKACLDAKPGRVGFIATEATVRSGLFVRLIRERNPDAAVRVRACPLYVPLVEEGWTDNAFTRRVTELYLGDWKEQAVDMVVLGCTHYPLLTGVIEEVLGPVRFINMAEYTARAAEALLRERDLLTGDDNPRSAFYVSGYADKFTRMAERVLGTPYTAECVALTRLE